MSEPIVETYRVGVDGSMSIESFPSPDTEKGSRIHVDGRDFDTPLDAALHLLWLLQRLSFYEKWREGMPCDGARFRQGIVETRKLLELLKYDP